MDIYIYISVCILIALEVSKIRDYYHFIRNLYCIKQLTRRLIATFLFR